MNALLVYPKYPDTFWSFNHILKFISKKAIFPPLGLMTVAAMLPNEWNKKLVDVNVSELKEEQIKWADIVFISAMIVQKESVKDVIQRCKAIGKKVVAGGPFFTTGSEYFDEVDHLVLDEAEITLPLFLEDFKNGNLKKIYSSKERPDITKTPIPLWSLINFNDYFTMAVQYSRGCPFNCEFCDIIIMNGRVPRTKNPEQLLNELQSIYDAGWRHSVFIVDDNFIGNKIKVKEMLSLLIKWQKERNYPFTLFTEASTNLADDAELMALMSAANFDKVFLGIETPDVNSLNECAKVQNKRDLKEAVKIIHQNGMQVMGGFIVGFDSDTEDIFETQIKFIQKTGVVTAMVGLLNALPKTRLWNRLQSENRLIGIPNGENVDGTINFIPKMSKEKLVEGYKKILSSIYSPKNYYKRISILIEDYKPTVRNKITGNMLRAAFKSMWSIGILSNERFLYWKIIIKTFFTKIRAINLAFELAIYRQHFKKIVKNVVQN